MGRQLLPSYTNIEGVTQLSHGKGIGKSFWRTKMLELLAAFVYVFVYVCALPIEAAAILMKNTDLSTF